MHQRKALTPLGVVVAGAAAGAIGTVCMDAVRFVRQRRGGGVRSPWEWEFAPVPTWQDAPDPGQIGRRLVEGFTQRELPDSAAWLVSTLMHWSYGSAWGGLYGVLSGSMRQPHVIHGAPFGAVVWISGYAAMPLAGLYEPIWKYDRKTLAADLTAHLAYGTGTSTAFWLFTRLLGARS
jgi:hypothetical protein